VERNAPDGGSAGTAEEIHGVALCPGEGSVEKDHWHGRGAADEQSPRLVRQRDHQLIPVLGERNPQNGIGEGILEITGHEGHDMVGRVHGLSTIYPKVLHFQRFTALSVDSLWIRWHRL
jgi:hypothetical protein